MVIERNSQESSALNLLRFPLAALVVLLHTSALSAPGDFTYFLANNINAPIVQIAVPAFFFMSGYLFFVGKEDFCFSVYKKKITKKVRTLLVPYIIWNFVALFLNYGYSYLTKGSLGDVMPWNLVEILWKHGEGIMGTSTLGGYQYPVIVSPTAGVLWFMRDLMMMMLCSIVGYHVIKRLKWWVFLLLLLVNIFHIGVPVVGFSLAAITFFHAGAFFSIHHIHVFDWLVQRKYLWLILWPVLVVLLGLLTCIDVEFNWMHSVVLFCGVAFVLVIAYYFAGKKNRILEIVSRWGETSFFIYTFGNTLILWFINKDFGYFLETIPFCGYFLNYEFLFLARVAECVFVYYLMKRYTPSLLSFVIGGRIIYKKNTRCS